jgi:hypothetical protein
MNFQNDLFEAVQGLIRKCFKGVIFGAFDVHFQSVSRYAVLVQVILDAEHMTRFVGALGNAFTIEMKLLVFGLDALNREIKHINMVATVGQFDVKAVFRADSIA